jgi:hypothetical protein
MTALVELLGGIRGTVFAGLALLFALLFGIALHGKHSAQVEFDKAQAAWAQQSLKQAEAVIQAQERARQQEQASQAMVSRIAADYETEKRNAQVQADRVAADLSSGALKLRQQWQACRSTADLSGVVASAAQPDSQDQLRAAGVGRVLGIVAACQAQRDGLIRVVEADRK